MPSRAYTYAGSLLQSGIAEKQARSIRCQLKQTLLNTLMTSTPKMRQ